MKRRILRIFLVVVFLFLLHFSIVQFNTLRVKKLMNEQYETISINDLKPGDILLARSSMFSGPIPGYWSHSAIFAGYQNGTPMILESLAETNVRKNDMVDSFNKKLHVVVLKVNATDEQKEIAIEYANNLVGKKFDFWYPSKQLVGESYYCSEIVWASYLFAGLDIDSNPGFYYRYANGVAPQEIFESEHVRIFNLEGY